MYPYDSPALDMSGIWVSGNYRPHDVVNYIQDNLVPINKNSLRNSVGKEISLIQNYMNANLLGRDILPVTSGYFENVLASGQVVVSGFLSTGAYSIIHNDQYLSANFTAGDPDPYDYASLSYSGGLKINDENNSKSISLAGKELEINDGVNWLKFNPSGLITTEGMYQQVTGNLYTVVLGSINYSGYSPIRIETIGSNDITLKSGGDVWVSGDTTVLNRFVEVGDPTSASSQGTTITPTGILHVSRGGGGGINYSAGLAYNTGMTITGVDGGPGGYNINSIGDHTTYTNASGTVNIRPWELNADDTFQVVSSDDINLYGFVNIRLDAVTGNIILVSLPTSAGGLPTGSIWNDFGTLKLAP